MYIPKKLREKVKSVTYRRESDDFSSNCYEVNLADGYSIDGEGLFFCDSKKDVLNVLEEAHNDN